MHRVVIGVMGAGDGADPDAVAQAQELGRRLAEQGWVVLSGGRDCGVMRAVNDGAKKVPGSLTVGVVPSESRNAAPSVDVVIATGLGSARNNVNVLSSDVVIGVGRARAGTCSEIALAIKAGKPVILLRPDSKAQALFESLAPDLVWTVNSVQDAVLKAREQLELRQSARSGTTPPDEG